MRSSGQENKSDQVGPEGCQFRWCEVGPGNPFNKRVLDVRSLTQTVMAATKHKSIADKYGELRGSDGKYLIGTSPSDALTIDCNIAYPHDGTELRGPVSKADCMDVKWDI